jgi:amino acid adenylation domain-containing protein
MIRITDQFIENCFKYPNNNALFINEKHFTYSELLNLTFSILLDLKKENNIDSKIAIYCSDDIETYSSILAVSILGACYVPINSRNPIQHSLEIIESAGIRTILHSNKIDIPQELTNYNLQAVFLETLNRSFSKQDFVATIHQENAYLLHTSGSTGKPKGVNIKQIQVEAFFDFFTDENRFHFSEKDRFIQPFELTFDVSVFCLFMPLNLGACCYVVPQNGLKFLETIRLMKDHSITVSTFVPSLLNHIDKYIEELQFLSLKYSFFIGDKLSHNLTCKWKKSIPNAEIFNFYGPTEATIMCSYYKWEESISKIESVNDVVPIGKLFPNLEFKIINEEKIAQSQEIGELYIYGNQVITSYNNLTNEDSFLNIEVEKKYYKTGDLVHLNEDGNLIYHSRVDRQVKINGYRIEINEIEACIRRKINHPFCVTTFKNKNQLNELVLFIEDEVEVEVEVEDEDLMSFLKQELPSYMIPQTVINIKKIPYNSNQKIDFKKLNEIYLLNLSI